MKADQLENIIADHKVRVYRDQSDSAFAFAFAGHFAKKLGYFKSTIKKDHVFITCFVKVHFIKPLWF